MMEKLRRSAYFFVCFQDIGFIDVPLLLQGTAKISSVERAFALSILKEETYPITLEELQLLSRIPSDKWIPVTEVMESFQVDRNLIRDLTSKGLILSDKKDGALAELRRRDEKLCSTQWNIHAALYHFLTKWHNMRLPIPLPDDIRELKEVTGARYENFSRFTSLFGKPPAHFYSRSDALLVLDLPIIKREGGLYDVLLKRKTTRAYDRETPMKLEDLSVVLYYVWGCHGLAPVWEDIFGLKKTSPSGGDLHPTEVYPLISNVNGLDPGLYHYNTQDHSLELLISMSQADVAELANKFTAGQSYPRTAHVTFIMTARFYRNFWKYRQHQKSYSVILMDAAHLSQAFYLVCTELGLGAFVTAAINNVDIEEKLGLDGITEGAIAICGCGEPLKDVDLDPVFFPYVPGARGS